MRARIGGAMLLILPAALVVGCGAQGPEFSSLPELGEDEAAIVVYRPSSLVLAATAPDIYLNGQKQGQLKNNGYLVFRVPTGRHLVEAKGSTLDWETQVGDLAWLVAARAGRTHFVRLNIRSGALLPFAAAMATPAAPARQRDKSPAYFSGVEPPEAMDQLKGLRLSK